MFGWQRLPSLAGSAPRTPRPRARLVDAAEQLLLEEGYAAVTSRRVGARAELKPQLVHYYFRTMDDLFTEVFRRRAEENLARFERAMAADPSLRTLWRLNADPRGAAFSIEFVALANHRKAIRPRSHATPSASVPPSSQALTAALAADGITAEQLPPIVALLLMTGISQILALEDALGVTAGHDATVSFVEGVDRSTRTWCVVEGDGDADPARRQTSLPELALEDLPRGVAGQSVEHGDLLRHLEACQLGAAVLQEQVRRHRRVLAHDDERHRHLAPSIIRTTHHGGLDHRVVLVENPLDLRAGDVLATRDDHVLEAIDDEEVSVLVADADVPGVEPATGERSAGSRQDPSSSP